MCATFHSTKLAWLMIAGMACLLELSPSVLAQTNSTWTGGAGNWGPCPPQGNALWNTCPQADPDGNYNAIIQGGPVTELNDNETIVNLTINSGDTLTIDGSYLYINGSSIANNGTIAILHGLGLRIGGSTVTLSGSGTLNLQTSDVTIYNAGGGVTTFVNQQTITGVGGIGAGGLTLTNQGTMQASGGTLTIQPSVSGLTNTGLLQATGGSILQIIYGVPAPLNNTGGTIQAQDGGTVVLESPTINGGTLTTTGNGVFQTVAGGANTVLNGVTLSGTYQILSASESTLTGTITNNGTIQLLSSGGATDLFINGTTTVKGTGSVTMSDNQNNFITGATGTDSLRNQITIQGSGTIDFVAFTNQGTVLANQLNPLIIATNKGFTNSGKIIVNSGSMLQIGNTFTNLSGGTLKGGTYQVSGTLQLPGDITTNAANITLTGTTSKIVDQNSANALAAFLNNAAKASFTLAGNQNFTSSAAFSNAGTMKISKGSTFTVGANGSYTQSGGTTTVDGALSLTGSGSVQITGGSLFGNGGGITGNVSSSGTITPADSATSTGTLVIAGNYTQNSSGALDINISSASQFNQLGISGTATLGGTLNIGRLKGFVPALNSTFKILTCTSLSGTFATVTGTSINSSEHFVVQYNSNNVTLQVVSGP